MMSKNKVFGFFFSRALFKEFRNRRFKPIGYKVGVEKIEL